MGNFPVFQVAVLQTMDHFRKEVHLHASERVKNLGDYGLDVWIQRSGGPDVLGVGPGPVGVPLHSQDPEERQRVRASFLNAVTLVNFLSMYYAFLL